MLNFGLTSVLMAVLTSTVLIIILTIIFLNESILYKFGLPILGIFCTLILLRMAFPFEFANINIIIKFPQKVSKFVAFILHPRIQLLGHVYSISEVCALIWIIVFLALFVDYICSIRKTYKFMQHYGVDVTNDYIFLIDKICNKKKLKEKISVIKLRTIQVPSVFRYRLHYYIFIPINLKLDEEEMELVFRHELSHVTHHDLTLKFLVQTLCLFYWWNLFCILLKKQSDLLFELRVDSSVVSKGHDKIERYLACLLKVKKYSLDNYNDNNKSELPPSSMISFLPRRSSALNKRFLFLMESNTTKNKYLTKLVLLPVCVLYLASFTFIFEAFYRGPENYIESDMDLTAQNMYIVINDKSTYDIYFNGVYAETVNSLENYPKNCKIYLSLEEAQEDENN